MEAVKIFADLGLPVSALVILFLYLLDKKETRREREAYRAYRERKEEELYNTIHEVLESVKRTTQAQLNLSQEMKAILLEMRGMMLRNGVYKRQ